jgi:HK97 family phage major capsid protein
MSLIEQLRSNRSAASAELEKILAPIVDAKRSATPEEETQITEKNGLIRSLDDRISDLIAHEESRAKQEAFFSNSPVVVKSEPRTYERSNNHQVSYFRDLFQMRQGSVGATERLQRHAREVEVIARANPTSTEARALSTADGAGGYFVPPVWLVDKYVKFAREGRPFAERTNKQEMIKGTDVINLPKITTGTATGAQTSGQNTGVLETDLTDSVVSSPVVTRAGQQTISLQMLEQSTIPFDEALMEDLLGALAEDIDTLCLTSPGGTGAFYGVTQLSGINAVTDSTATPTGGEIFQDIVKGISLARRNRHRMPTAIFMTAARWFWLTSQLDSSGRPLVVPSDQGVINAIATLAKNNDGDAPIETPAGTIYGIPVVIDDHIPTNLGTGTDQDEIVVARMSDLWLYESVPTFRNLPQTYGQNLSVLFQIYEYAAFLARHDKGISVVGGAAFVAPAGY